MKHLEPEVVRFFQSQNFTVVSTIDETGLPYCACKGVIRIEPAGRIYLLDLYKGRTYTNLLRNPSASITAVDEHSFRGYCIQGKAHLLSGPELTSELVKMWEEKIAGRITQRVLRNIKELRGHVRHPEAMLPTPEYIIMMEAASVIDLTPPNLR